MPISAALSAGLTRLRPVLMTALAMIIGMLPMALGLGEGGEQNAPLGRAVIGGLSVATLATLFFVPVVYSVLRHKQAQVSDDSRGCFAESRTVDPTMTSRPYQGVTHMPITATAIPIHACLQKYRLTGSGRPAEAASA